MKNYLFLGLALALASPASFAAENGKEKMDPKIQEMMQKWKDAATPGAPHAVLKSMVGNWKYTSKMWHSSDSVPEESSGRSKFKMVLGGRFLTNETKGKAMGQAFEGIGYTGYNNMTKKYETFWMDNMSTATMHGTGSFDEATKTLTDVGEFSCPMREGPQKYRSELKIIDKNNMIFTMYMPDMATGK